MARLTKNKHQMKAEQSVAAFKAYFPKCEVRTYDNDHPKGMHPHTIEYSFKKLLISQKVLNTTPEDTVKQLYEKIISHQIKEIADVYSNEDDPILDVRSSHFGEYDTYPHIDTYVLVPQFNLNNPRDVSCFAAESINGPRHELFQLKISPNLTVSRSELVKNALKLEDERDGMLILISDALGKLGYKFDPFVPHSNQLELKVANNADCSIPLKLRYDIATKEFKTQFAVMELKGAHQKWCQQFLSHLLELTPEKLRAVKHQELELNKADNLDKTIATEVELS